MDYPELCQGLRLMLEVSCIYGRRNLVFIMGREQQVLLGADHPDMLPPNTFTVEGIPVRWTESSNHLALLSCEKNYFG